MLKIALAQINPTVGDLTGNTRKILAYALQAQKRGADLVIFPELALCGYPPEDLLLKKHFVADNSKSLQALAGKIHGIVVITGFVDSDRQGKIYNAAAVIADGGVQHVYHKQELPNYGVFDREKIFYARGAPGRFNHQRRAGRDQYLRRYLGRGAVDQAQAKAGAKILINISSSPYHAGKLKSARTF